MSLYRYRAKDRKGHKYKGIREGENEAQLVKSLAEDGLYCYFLQNEDRVVSMRHFTVPLKWLPPFCSQVSSMLSSGVPQSDILKTACKTAPTREMKALRARLEEKIHRGQTLSEAMGSMGKCFPKLLIYMIQTGEASGTLDDILQKMSVYYAKEVEMEGKVRTAMIYPFILLLASIGASVFLLTTVLPQFADILEEYELPAITRFMMAAGEHLQKDWILYCLWIPVVFLVFALLSAVPKLRLRVDGLFFHIPVIAGLLKTIYTSRFASAFSLTRLLNFPELSPALPSPLPAINSKSFDSISPQKNLYLLFLFSDTKNSAHFLLPIALPTLLLHIHTKTKYPSDTRILKRLWKIDPFPVHDSPPLSYLQFFFSFARSTT